MLNLFMHPGRWLVSQTSQFIELYCDGATSLIDYDGMADLWEGVARASRVGIRYLPIW